MSANILDGKALAAQLREDLHKEVEACKARYGRVPSLVSIAVGDHHASDAYIQSQIKTAEHIGIKYKYVPLSKASGQDEVLDTIRALNDDHAVHGILINKPLPAHLDLNALVSAIAPDKDVEGLNVYNLGRLLAGTTPLIPCTAAAAMAHIKSVGVDLKGKEAVVLGRSEIVGKPIALLLLKENATVTICHSGTKDLAGHVRTADIVVAAVGQPLFVKGDWIKPGAIVIDVGINQIDDKMVGDVDFVSAKEKAAHITPVPGGVGPVTSVMLMKNAVEAFKAQVK